MLIAAFIFVISIAATVQFAVFSWRANLIHAVSAGAPGNLLKENSFEDVSAYQKLCPELTVSPAPKLRSVQLYYSLMQAVSNLGAAFMPSANAWTNREMALCTQYAAVTLSQRMVRNQALLAEVRSY
jgi:hypothetical protein